MIVVTVNTNICTAQQTSSGTLTSEWGGWRVAVKDDGSILELLMPFNGEMISIPWRSDEFGGPAWTGVKMRRVEGDKLLFEGRVQDQTYSLEYRDINGNLTLIAGIENHATSSLVADPDISVRLGIDNEMKDPETYYTKFFPTLLRCEKTHFWGYFQNPNGQILTIVSPDPVASRSLEYTPQRHRIVTSSLNFMNTLPLPGRHPQNLINLAPGEERSWSIVLQPAMQLDDVLPSIAAISKAPAISLDRTTAAPGEIIEITIYFDSVNKPDVSITDPSGKMIELPKPVRGNTTIKYDLNAPAEVGNYRIKAISNNRQSEAIFHIRKSWGWYLKQARSEALRMQIKPMEHREGWLGFFTAYWAHSYFPDDNLLGQTERDFNKFYALMVDSTKTDFYHDKETWHSRPQNNSWMVGMMVARYAATKKPEDLEEAARWGDHFIEKFQLPNGAFEGYTALTLGGKFLAELAFYERPLAKSSTVWKERYDRHIRSVEKAAENLLEVQDMGDTEGEATYEDTQAGSAWSLLAFHAIKSKNDSSRKKYLKASLEIQRRHECLTQAIIPDGRMRNGSLRFWESQYDVLTLPNMMNSPHGWTMRSQFGAFYLYLLTGEERYLNIMNNAMGACVQAIDEKTGILRWAFIPDPYIEARTFVPDSVKPGQGKHIPMIIGEQWLPMISDWWRVPEGEIGAMIGFQSEGFQNVTQGWSCDNDVHEHFRVLTEQFIPNAFVLEREDGSLRTMNCQVNREGSTLTVKLDEDVISRVHFNLKNKYNIVVAFSTEKFKQAVDKGMHWVGPGGVPELLR